ncbi:MAG TPA: site-2 protease family protein [Candidatus Ozemobacteraceae bacterium]|nr:site-2 protease family protein [Candidatus Ozemobacteraceae bacterium]
MPNGSSRIYTFRSPGGMGDNPFRKLYLIGGIIVALFLISFALAGPERLMGSLIESLVTIPVILISLTFHEWGHAAMAVFLGDTTPARMGRLSLNPMRHLELFGTLMLLFTSFGWAKPVPVDPSNFRIPGRAMMAVSLAGPALNLFLAFCGGGLLWLGYRLIPTFALPIMFSKLFIAFSLSMIIINLSLACFNLIPLPPLDGSKVLAYFLPPRYRLQYKAIEEMGPFLLVMMLAFGLVNSILSPMIGFGYKSILQIWGLI